MGLQHEQNNAKHVDASAVAELEKRVEVLQEKIAKSGQKIPSKDDLIAKVFRDDRDFHQRWRRESGMGG